MKCAFLTMQNPGDFVVDYDLCFAAMAERGWSVDPDGSFLLMELELIEPSLYFRTNDAAPDRFAAAFDEHCRRR